MTVEAIRRLYRHCIDRSGLGTVEAAQPHHARKTKGTIIIESTTEAEESARWWGDLNAECFWTDGSHLPDRYIGVAVVRQVNRQFEAKEYYLGTNKEVFDAELSAIYRALHSAQCLHDAG
jgi:hypothetical protein